MLMKQRFYYKARDSAQVGVFAEKNVTSHRPVRSDRSFKPWRILYKERTYFWDEEGVWQAKVVYFHQLRDDFEEYHSTWPKER